MLVLAAIIAVGGCSGQAAFWKGSEPEAAPSGASTGSVYYAGQANLPLYGEPSTAKAPVARLPLHKKVHRDKIENGYAHVKVDGTGQTGWVVNAKLIWKLPSSTKAAAPPEVPPAPPEAKVETPAQPEAAKAAETPSAPAKKSVDPSVFDAF